MKKDKNIITLLPATPKVKITFIELITEFEDHLYTEPNVFNREIEIYRNNVLRHLMDIVGKEISRLTELQREVLIRLYYKKESTYQLAESLGISRQGIQGIIRRALSSLQRRLIENPYFTQLYAEFKADDPQISELIKIADYLDSKK